MIGTGPSGLSQLHAFERARQVGHAIPEVVCFEKQPDWGGMWRYTWRTGLDEHGEPVHASMYRDLWSNGPKECIEYPDYPFDGHFQQPVPSYLPRADILDYVSARAERAGLGRYIRFETAVTSVSPAPDTGRLRLTSRSLPSGEEHAEEFDWVVVATGHFSAPNAPTFPGFDAFPGRILHSHDLRDVAELRGRRVLLVGAGDSAEDIALQAHKYGARSITISYRSAPLGHPWPPTIVEVPLLTHLDGRIAHFADGQSAPVDVIVLCTGYRHSFAFVDPSLRLATRNRLCPDGLYKGILLQHDPRLIYLGMQYPYYTFTMFEAQAWYARDVILGRRALPAGDERAADLAAWQAAELEATTGDEELDLQTRYIADLLSGSDYPPVDLTALAALFRQVEADKAQDILGFRDRAMTSVFTGTPAAPPARPWLEAFAEEAPPPSPLPLSTAVGRGLGGGASDSPTR